MWRVNDWSWVRTFVGHRSGVYEIAFSPDGRLLLTASDDKTARLWRVDSGKEIGTPIQHESPVWAVDISPDGSTIATGSEDSTVQLWDLAYSDGNAKIQNHTTLRLSDGPVWWLRFHRDSTGIRLGITGQDRTLRIFNISRFKMLFSNPKVLEEEAQSQSGLMVTGTSEEPQILTAIAEPQAGEQLGSSAQATTLTHTH
jgi:WD40 repeat protein